MEGTAPWDVSWVSLHIQVHPLAFEALEVEDRDRGRQGTKPFPGLEVVGHQKAQFQPSLLVLPQQVPPFEVSVKPLRCPYLSASCLYPRHLDA